MKIFFLSKHPGSIRQTIEPVSLELKRKPVHVAELIRLIVEKIVEEYNIRAKVNADDQSVLIEPYEDFEIQNLAASGKIAFGLIYNERSVSLDRAIETALRGYEDGLFKIFINDVLLGDLDSDVNVADGDVLTVVRLTFLSGRII